MTDLTDLTERLHQAAAGPAPGFSADDVRRRVDQRRRRGRGMAAALLVLAIVGASLVVTRALDHRGQSTVRAAGSIGTADLTASPWILTAVGGDPVVVGVPTWVSFDSNGSIVGDGGCGPFIASWRWAGDALEVDGLDSRPGGCDQLDGSSVVETPELIVGALGSDPVPSPSEAESGGLRLSAGTPDAAFPWIELTRFDNLDPVVDGTVVTSRWIAADGSAFRFEAETVVGETACRTASPWSLGADGLDIPACVSDVLSLTGPGPWEVRSSWSSLLWLRDGERLVWLRRDIDSTPPR